MKNPWAELPTAAPFVLPSDWLFVDNYNVLHGKKDEAARIHVDLLPEPFLGRPNAPVVVLALQPSVSAQDAIFHKTVDYFIDHCRRNLVHDNQNYPFYLLDPDPRIAASPGAQWWHEKLNGLIADCGRNGQHDVARNVFVVQMLGYHCERWQTAFPSMPSQKYAFHLVENAMARQAHIIVLYKGRSTGGWLDRMPELIDYPQLYTLQSTQAPHITEKNCPEGYHKCVRAITSA